MIANPEQVEGPYRAIEQARPVEAPAHLPNRAVGAAAGERRVKHRRQPHETVFAEREYDPVGVQIRQPRMLIEADHMQHRRIARPEQGTQRQRGRQFIHGWHLRIESFVTPTELEPFILPKAFRHGGERRQCPTACGVSQRLARQDDPGMMDISDHKHVDARGVRRRRIEDGVARTCGDNDRDDQCHREETNRPRNPPQDAPHGLPLRPA